MRGRGYGAGLRARCQCVAERATALKARVLHARAWNLKCRIFADPRNCCAHDPPNHAEAIAQELCMAMYLKTFFRVYSL